MSELMVVDHHYYAHLSEQGEILVNIRPLLPLLSLVKMRNRYTLRWFFVIFHSCLFNSSSCSSYGLDVCAAKAISTVKST